MITFSIGYDIRTYIERKKILQFDALKWEMFKLWALFCICVWLLLLLSIAMEKNALSTNSILYSYAPTYIPFNNRMVFYGEKEKNIQKIVLIVIIFIFVMYKEGRWKSYKKSKITLFLSFFSSFLYWFSLIFDLGQRQRR